MPESDGKPKLPLREAIAQVFAELSAMDRGSFRKLLNSPGEREFGPLLEEMGFFAAARCESDALQAYACQPADQSESSALVASLEVSNETASEQLHSLNLDGQINFLTNHADMAVGSGSWMTLPTSGGFSYTTTSIISHSYEAVVPGIWTGGVSFSVPAFENSLFVSGSMGGALEIQSVHPQDVDESENQTYASDVNGWAKAA